MSTRTTRPDVRAPALENAGGRERMGVGGCPAGMRTMRPRRCALALLLLSAGALAACSGDDPRTVPVVAKVETKAAAPVTAPPSAEALAERYLAIKDRFAALQPEDKAGPARILAEDGPELRTIAESSPDTHLRANASLLLGTLYEDSGDARSAISFYRQVVALLPGEVEPHRVLAMALALDKQFAAALPEQELVVKDDPDDLEAWLLLGEVAFKAGENEQATLAYAAYEMRRKGLTDGISLKRADGTFPLPAEQRAACARALIPARDNGTALALLYALEIETDPSVRVAIVEAMGTQRLAGYKTALTAKLKTESAQEVKEALIWALAEIQRDPLDTRPGPTPVDPKAAAPADAANTGDAAGDAAKIGDAAKAADGSDAKAGDAKAATAVKAADGSDAKAATTKPANETGDGKAPGVTPTR